MGRARVWAKISAVPLATYLRTMTVHNKTRRTELLKYNEIGSVFYFIAGIIISDILVDIFQIKAPTNGAASIGAGWAIPGRVGGCDACRDRSGGAGADFPRILRREVSGVSNKHIKPKLATCRRPQYPAEFWVCYFRLLWGCVGIGRSNDNARDTKRTN